MSSPSAVICDVGNVVLPFDPLKPCAVLGERCGRTALETARLIYHGNLERAFEEGRIDGRQFTDGAARLLGLELDYDWFHDLWADMFTENEAVSRIVRGLRAHHQVILLSNANVWHWHHAETHFPIIQEIKRRVLSCEVGVLKPHPAIYRAALEMVAHHGTVVFIDDMALNVSAADMLGMKGILFRSAEQLDGDLRRLNCLF